MKDMLSTLILLSFAIPKRLNREKVYYNTLKNLQSHNFEEKTFFIIVMQNIDIF